MGGGFCIKPEAALKVRRHKTMEICNLCPDENYELILEWKSEVSSS